jgi:hypothetical protein
MTEPRTAFIKAATWHGSLDEAAARYPTGYAAVDALLKPRRE